MFPGDDTLNQLSSIVKVLGMFGWVLMSAIARLCVCACEYRLCVCVVCGAWVRAYLRVCMFVRVGCVD